MKLIATTAAAALLTASTAFGGALIFEPVEEPEIVIVEPEAPAPMMGTNLAWIVPLIGLAAIGIAIAASSSDDDS